MADFKSLSEGEKLAWSKDFLIKFRTIQKLRPELTEEMDVLTLVAKKYYDEKIEELEECVKFIESKTEIPSLANVNLEPAVQEYESNLKQRQLDAMEQVEKGKKEILKKKQKLEQQSALRNYYDKLYRGEAGRIKANADLKNILKLSLLAFVIIALVSVGGLAGIGSTILTLMSGLTSVQLLTIAGIAYLASKKGWMKSIGGKFKEISKAKKDKEAKQLESLKKDRDNQEKEHEKVSEEFAKAQTEIIESLKTEQKTRHELEAESIHLSKYSKLNELDRAIKMSEVEITDQFENALRQYDSDDEKKNLTKWKEHYVAALYFGATQGMLRTREDLDALVEISRNKFEQLSNPLNVNRTFTEENVRAQTDAGVNKPIEEMFQSI